MRNPLRFRHPPICKENLGTGMSCVQEINLVIVAVQIDGHCRNRWPDPFEAKGKE